jgi:hypothetical protein
MALFGEVVGLIASKTLARQGVDCQIQLDRKWKAATGNGHS